MPTSTRLRLPKTRRAPELIRPFHLTERDLSIIATIERYRFIPTSLVLALIPGSDQVISRRLRILYHHEFINRFAFRTDRKMGQFIYYLDNPAPLRLLVDRAGIPRDKLHWQWARYNREANYAEVARTNKYAEKLRFLNHELRVSGFHAMLELACRHPGGRVELTGWERGRGRLKTRVEVPKVTAERTGDEWQWFESQETETLALGPDALFELYYPELPEGEQYAHFAYEMETGSGDSVRYRRRLRAYFHFIAKQKQHQTKWGIARIRAVLTEAPEPVWRDQLREAARHPIVSGGGSSPLFLFTASSLLSEPRAHPRRPRFITEPTRIFERVWHTPDSAEPISILER